MYIYFVYKNERKIELYNFTEFNKIYEESSLVESINYIKNKIKEHPEVLL